jgi:uracil permease
LTGIGAGIFFAYSYSKVREELDMNEKKTAVGQEPIRDARTLGVPKMLILGLQHMFAMFGATVLVPILVQSYGLPLSIQTTLFFAGIGTLFFHVCTKMKVPAFLGSSFAFLGGFYTMAAMDSGIYVAMEPAEKLQYACGGIFIAGLLYVVLAAIVKLVGVHRVMHYLPPVVTGPIIILIGLNLAPSAVSNASTCWWLALVSMAIIIVCNIWGKGMIKIIPILLGVVGSYIVALIAGMVDFSGLADTALFSGANPILGLQPFFTNFGGCVAKFDVSAILVMAPIAIASMMEHIGDMSAISATVGENFIEDPGLHRTLIGDGIATSLSAIFGGPANTTYGENTGVLVLSKVHDPRVIRLAAVYAVVLSFSPAFAYIVNSIPAAIIGGVSFILYGMISAIGVRNVVENQVDFTNSRNLIIAAVILVCGLGFTDGLTFVVGGASITLTSLSIAAIAGIALNAILPGNDFHFGKSANDASGNLGQY